MTPLITILPVSVKIPRAVRDHRNFREAYAIATALMDGKGVSHGGVIGTSNNNRAELYGWHNPVAPHIDNPKADTYIYGTVLSRGKLKQIGLIDHDSGKVKYIQPGVGEVFRLNDRYTHWTEGGGSTVAIFVGEYSEPCDYVALELIQRGVNRLANGVRTAPRVSPGFMIPAEDECYATHDFEKTHLVHDDVAKRDGWVIAECGCGKKAHRLDRLWPHDSYGNICLECMALTNRNLD